MNSAMSNNVLTSVCTLLLISVFMLRQDYFVRGISVVNGKSQLIREVKICQSK
jgi:hypothetical protein